jgi:DNA-binding response OmpR family regulator
MASMLGIREFPRQIGESEECGGSFANHQEDTVTVGDFHLELRSQRVLVKGREIQLNAAEFEMLAFLISHHTNVVTPQTRLTTRGGRVIEQGDFLRLLAGLQRKLESVPGGAGHLRTEPWLVCRFHPGGQSDQ